MRVLLVANQETEFGLDRSIRLPNLGLSSIAGNLDRELCEVKVVDLVVAGRNPRKRLHRTLKKFRPDVIGLSCMTFQYNESFELARIAKLFDKDITVVMGGYHPTVAYDLILKNEDDIKSIDFLIRNEGEVAFNELLKAMEKGNDFSNVPNLSRLNNGSIIHNPRSDVLDLERIKLPDRDARINTKGFHIFGYPADVIETSRGCSFSCDFCCIRSMYGRSYRTYRIDRVLDDIRDARSHGAQAIFIADDNITLDGKRFAELCDAIIDARLNTLKYFPQVSVRGLHRTPGLIEKMAASGVRWVFLGIENTSHENLDFLDKSDQFEISDVDEVLKELRRNNILVIAGFIIGNPDDTEESIRANYEYAKRLKIDIPVFVILTPYPKTEVREKLLAQELITNEHDFTQYTCFKACVKTKHVSAERLYELREELGYRYPIDSGAVWRVFKKFTIPFRIRLVVGEFVRDPMEVIRYFKGLLGPVKSISKGQ